MKLADPRQAHDREERQRIVQLAAAQNDLHERLTWLHGRGHADAVLYGLDQSTEADVARWEALGRDD